MSCLYLLPQTCVNRRRDNMFKNCSKQSSLLSICGLFLCIVLQTPGSESLCTPTLDGFKRFGPDCKFRCHCFNRTEQCNTETGVCTSGCDFEWAGPGCRFRNIALGMCNSRHLDNTVPEHFSHLAIDHDVTTCSYTDDETSSQSRTVSPWWAYWFPNDVTLSEFVFMTRDVYLKYFPGFYVTVQQGISITEHEIKVYRSGELCYQHDRSTPPKSTVYVKCIKNLVGNQLRIQLANTSTQLVFCDFRVYGGCDDGIYGENCLRVCSENCRKTNCSKENGTCINGCNPGFTGNNCFQECNYGTYGTRCEHNCSAYCNGPCNNVDGTCLSCKAGWKGNKCTLECDDWKYGKGCSKICSDQCITKCNKTDGSCSPCKAGWKGIRCLTECHDGMFGTGCNNTCSQNCDGICDKERGTCMSCKAGWMGSFCTTVVDKAETEAFLKLSEGETAGAVVAVILLIVVSILVTLLVPRRNNCSGVSRCRNRPENLNVSYVNVGAVSGASAKKEAGTEYETIGENKVDEHMYESGQPKE